MTSPVDPLVLAERLERRAKTERLWAKECEWARNKEGARWHHNYAELDEAAAQALRQIAKVPSPFNIVKCDGLPADKIVFMQNGKIVGAITNLAAPPQTEPVKE